MWYSVPAYFDMANSKASPTLQCPRCDRTDDILQDPKFCYNCGYEYSYEEVVECKEATEKHTKLLLDRIDLSMSYFGRLVLFVVCFILGLGYISVRYRLDPGFMVTLIFIVAIGGLSFALWFAEHRTNKKLPIPNYTQPPRA